MVEINSRDLLSDNNVTMTSIIVQLSYSLSNVIKGYILDSFVIWDSEERGD